MMETELDDHLEYQKSEHLQSDDYRNGYKDKQINSCYGSMKIEVPQNRQSTFELQVEEWQNRPLSEIYPVLFINAIHYSVRDNGIIRKLAAYIILGINPEGRKEIRKRSILSTCDASRKNEIIPSIKKISYRRDNHEYQPRHSQAATICLGQSDPGTAGKRLEHQSLVLSKSLHHGPVLLLEASS